MFYPEEIIEEVRLKNNIKDVIGSYIHLHKKGSNYMGLCPFHNEKTPSFSVSDNKQMYHCFGCGVGGNVFTFIMEYENYTFIEALKFLAERAGVSLPEREYSPMEKRAMSQKTRLLEINKEAAKFYYYTLSSNQGKIGYQYLIDRGLTKETIKKFGLGYSNQSGNGLYQYLKKSGYEDQILKETGLFSFKEVNNIYDRFWNRVMFPIMDVNNRVIGFGGRVMGKGEPKYLNSPETKVFDKSRNLYGLNLAKISRKDNIIICEGYMDVIALYQAGFHNVVASLGTAFTERQANLLKRYTREVLLCYDSDAAGIKAALRAIPILEHAGLNVKVINLKPHKDPDDFIKVFGVDEFQNRIDNSQNAFLYEIDVLEKDFNMDDPSSKTRFFNEVAKKLLKFTEAIERNSYTETIAKKYYIGFDDLRRLVNRYGSNVVIDQSNETKKNRKYEQRQKNNPTNGLLESQKILLTWLIENPTLFKSIEGIIEPKDFSLDLYKQVAEMLFDQYNTNSKLIPAKIINYFESKEEQTEAASLFTTEISGEMNDTERKKAFTETVLRIKAYSLDRQSEEAIKVNDVEKLQKIIRERTNLQKLHISFYDG